MINKNLKTQKLVSTIMVAICLFILLLSGCKKEKERGCDGDGICEPLYGEDKNNCDDCP